MKAISLWQPWASLWACGRKHYETREWSTPYRGSLLVHAAKTLCVDVSDELRKILEDEFGPRWMNAVPTGGLIGRCDLIDCIPTEHLNVDYDERAQGNFQRGRYAWGPANMEQLDRVITLRGLPGLFDVDTRVLGLEEPAAPPPPAQAKLL